MQNWNSLVKGLAVKRLQGNIFNLKIQGLGDSDIGPYKELLKFSKGNKRYKLRFQVHHIVNGEHLDGTGWEYDVAPCIVLEESLHVAYHARFNGVLPTYHGRTEMGKISQKNKLALYHDMFVDQTRWVELWTISARIITGTTKIPSTKSFIDD